jgi:hypothetical protein
MASPPARALVAAAAIALAAAPARGWAPETRMAMVDEAVRFMPDGLRLALGNHRDALMRGMLEPMTEEDGPAHRPTSGGGLLATSVADEAEALVAALGQPVDFATVARRFGRLAHFIADAGFPPGAGGAAGAERYGHFASFCDSRRGRFPLVFHGGTGPELRGGDWAAFASRLLEQAAARDSDLATAYRAAGSPPDPAAFDDRSVPFAIGSLSWSRTINDIAGAWLTAWSRGGGDMSRRPVAAASGGAAR